jgi:hypothetical protein
MQNVDTVKPLSLSKKTSNLVNFFTFNPIVDLVTILAGNLLHDYASLGASLYN